MSRHARILMIIALLIGVWALATRMPLIVVAQEEPLPTAENSQQFATLPPVDTPVFILDTPTPEGTLPVELAPTDAGQILQPEQPQAQPTAIPLGVEQSEAIPSLIVARADLELLATTAIGSEQRPLGWSGSIDVTDPQLPLWIRLDLETLAGAILGVDQRPGGWFGVVPSIPLAVVRDIRHDLELLADVVIGAQGLRPAGWNGDDPMMRCSRATQSLFTLLQSRGITFEVDFTQPNYCTTADNAASLYVERNILQPPPAVIAGVAINQGRYAYQVDNPFVVAFLDRKARSKIGVLPIGTGFEAIGRSTVEFSNMMLVRGDNFQVFLDYTTTQITNEQFSLLPDIGDATGTNCQAVWCGVGLD